MISPATLMADRISMGIEIKQLAREKVALERSIPLMEADPGAARRELNEYRAYISGRYSG